MPDAIITCAPTGAIHTPSMSPYLPVTPHQIAEAALAAADAGAAIVHLHVRDPHDGHPVQDTGLFRELIAEIQSKSDVVVNLTTGGSPHMTVDERIQPAMDLAPELASLEHGHHEHGAVPDARPVQGPRARLGADRTWGTRTSSSRTPSPTSSGS